MPETIAPLTVTQVNVTSAGGLNYKEVSVSVDAGTASLSYPSGADLGSKPGVVSVDHPSPKSWTINFDDGTAWLVSRGGCGCGGR